MLGANQYSRTYGAPAQELRPDFFMDTVKDEVASREAGRAIHREVERVRIIIPGAVASIVVKNVDNSHRERWPKEYDAFRAGREQPLSGMALKEWPVLNRAMVEELHHLQIRTVEELANLSDIQVQHIGMGGQMLRARAKAYLDDAEYEALTTKLTAENDLMRSRIAALEGQVNELGRQLLIMAQQRQLPDPGVPGFQSHVPGQNDPRELQAYERQAFQGTLVEPPATVSALDTLADQPLPRSRHRRGSDPNFDPAAADDLGAGEEAA
jgi:hypothetical protein